jgi:tyrosine-protein kinase Etk/Wzc
LQYTEESPEITQAETQLAELRAQLKRQQANRNTQKPGEGLHSTANLPGLTLEYLRREREVKLNETMYDALLQQYEKARIAEADTGPQLQIVDHAIVPERKSGPPRKLIVIAGLFLGFLSGFVNLFARERYRQLKRQYHAIASRPSAG